MSVCAGLVVYWSAYLFAAATVRQCNKVAAAAVDFIGGELGRYKADGAADWDCKQQECV